MAITSALCSSFKQEILQGIHAFGTSVVRAGTGADTFKIALYTSSATLGASTTAYSATNEVANGNGYTTAGNTLTPAAPTLDSTTAILDFTDSVWSAATITANGALIYNDTQSDKAVSVHAFGADKTSTAGDFTVIFPAAAAATAIIRIA